MHRAYITLIRDHPTDRKKGGGANYYDCLPTTGIYRGETDKDEERKKEGDGEGEGERKSLKAAVTRLHKADQLLKCKHSRRRMDQSGELLKAHPVTCVLGEEGRTN